MSKNCFVNNCPYNKSDNVKKDKISLFYFPQKQTNPLLFYKWIDFLEIDRNYAIKWSVSPIFAPSE